MTRLEQLEAAVGILLEAIHEQMPTNPRLIPDWYVACAACCADQTNAQHINILQQAHAQALSRMRTPQ